MFSVSQSGNDINSRRIKSFIADTIADVDKLPHINAKGTQDLDNDVDEEGYNEKVLAGSSCFVIEGARVFMLNNADEWKEL